MNKKVILCLFLVLAIVLACQVPDISLNNTANGQNNGQNIAKTTPEIIGNPFNLSVGNATVRAFPVGLNIRDDASANATVLATAPDNSTVKITGILANGWVSLCWQKICGFANARYLSQ